MNSTRISTIAMLAAGLMLSACDTPADSDDAANAAKEEPAATAATGEPKVAETEDPFLWLEEVEGDRAIEWVKSQNERSLAELEGDARYAPLLDQAKAILNSDERIAGAGLRGGFAYNFWQDETNTRGLWRRMAVADYVAGSDDWDVILDLDALAEAEGENWVYKGVDCLEPDYNRCILTLSRGGSDASVRREFDVASKSFVEGGFELAEAKASTTWIDQDTLLSGMDLGAGTMTESGYARTIREWSRGQTIEEAKVVFEGEETDVGVFPFSSQSGDVALAGIIRSMTFYDRELFWRNDSGSFDKLDLPTRVDLEGLIGGQYIISLNENWEKDGTSYMIGSVISLDPRSGEAALLYEPAGRVAVQSVSTSNNSIFITLLDNIAGKVIKLTPDGDGWQQEAVDLPDQGVVSVSSVDDATGDALVYFENPTTPETLYYLASDTLEPEALKSTPEFFDTEGMITRQYEATSSDGTKIPYFVTAKQSVLDAGPAPTIQYGYGGFQISITPTYSGTTGKMWLENGGVYVIANIRGGGEFGPEWHQAVLKQNRQKAFDDFFAVSEDLIAKGITTTDQLGILGGSNGGLLMGVAMTQRPDLYNAIGIGVPLLDMLRYDKLLAGASWVGEYGDPDNPEDRPHLEAWSPYQNLKADGDYPRVYFFTSTKDDRVHPGHARKMAAKMESYGQSFLYYENIEGGHAASANQDQLAKRLALQYVYFSRQLADQ